MIRRKIFAFLLTVLLAASQIGAVKASPAQTVSTAKTPIQHVVVLMQENHTFDNYFGTYPGADGLPNGTKMPLSLAPRRDCQKLKRDA